MQKKNPTANVRLTFSATNLYDADFGPGKSDPMVLVARRDAGTGRFATVGQTEMIPNNLSPKWTEEVTLPYVFGDLETLHFAVVDVDSNGQDALGSCSATLDSLVRNGGSEFALKSNGRLFIVAEIVEDSNEFARMELRGTKISNMDGLFGKSDPFLLFRREVVRDDGSSSWITFHRTEVVKNTKTPVWRPFTLSMSEMCNCDDMRKIVVECHDWDSDDSTDFIGAFETTIGELRAGRTAFELRDPKKKKARGEIEFVVFDVYTKPNFASFVHAGLQISVNFWIDATGSNGRISSDSSLHCLGRQQTAYEGPLRALHEVLKEHDSDGSFGVGFFGGKFGGSGVTDHAFAAGERTTADDICALYRDTIRGCRLSGPTYFSHILRAALTEKATQGTYRVHVIFTDGIINDMDSVKGLLRRVGGTPTSVLIVGIGNGDPKTGFEDMRDLDDLDDDEAKENVRDVADFVQAKSYPTPETLRAAVLAEIPRHIEDYMWRSGYKPDDIARARTSAGGSSDVQKF